MLIGNKSKLIPNIKSVDWNFDIYRKESKSRLVVPVQLDREHKITPQVG